MPGQPGDSGDEAHTQEAFRQVCHIIGRDVADGDTVRRPGLMVELRQYLAQDGRPATGGDADGDVHASGPGGGEGGAVKPASRPRKLCQ